MKRLSASSRPTKCTLSLSLSLHTDPVQEWGEEEDDGAIFGITLRREPVPQSSDAAEQPTTFSFVQYHTVKSRRLKAATLERLVTHLLDSEHREPDFLPVFLSTYRAFTCPDEDSDSEYNLMQL
uniref:N-terminal Ras-GEF domain-containing protein n=1 Tax=Gouania willdenowi TaxID=441366 RepID=A0A8C5DP29_GOUWI